MSRAPHDPFTESDEEAGLRGPCQSAIYTARYDTVRLRRLQELSVSVARLHDPFQRKCARKVPQAASA